MSESSQKKDIPVCTLFNENGADDQHESESDSLFPIQTNEPSSKCNNTIGEILNLSNNVSGGDGLPVNMCNMFESVSSVDDLFSGISNIPENCIQSSSVNMVSSKSAEICEHDETGSKELICNTTESESIQSCIGDDAVSSSNSFIPASSLGSVLSLENSSVPAIDETSIAVSSAFDVETDTDPSGPNNSAENVTLTDVNRSDESKNNELVMTSVSLEDDRLFTAELDVQQESTNKIISTAPSDGINSTAANVNELPTNAGTDCGCGENGFMNNTNDTMLTSMLFSSATTSSSPFLDDVQEEFINSTISDEFTSALNLGEIERRRNAWIASDDIRAILQAASSRLDLDEKYLIRPGLSTSESLGNPMKKQMENLTRSIESNEKNMEVSPDAVGLQKLIKSGNLRAAVDLCGNVLTNLGQGFGKSTQPSENSPNTLSWWNARLSLLVRLNLHDVAEAELVQFKDLDSPDLYFKCHPQVYPGRTGTMVPFSLRLLHAMFPIYRDSPTQALDRLYTIQHVCKKIEDNLRNGLTEEGMAAQLKPDDKQASQQLWKSRHILVLHCIGCTLLRMREYDSAFRNYDQILYLQPSDDSVAVQIHSGVGRWLLQLGEIRAAQQRFALADAAARQSAHFSSQLTMNRAFLYLGANNWKDALNQFNEAIKINPANLEARNNKAVCLLYLCRLKEGIDTLEEALFRNPAIRQQLSTHKEKKALEGACSNLVTLYELESSGFHVKKMYLMQQMASRAGDGFDISCLKL